MDPPATPPAQQTPFQARSSPGLAEFLEREGVSLLLSTYQAGRLMAVRAAQGVVWTELRSFDRPMGLAVRNRGQFVLATQHHVWDFRDAPSLAGRLTPAGQYDACFIPRVS